MISCVHCDRPCSVKNFVKEVIDKAMGFYLSILYLKQVKKKSPSFVIGDKSFGQIIMGSQALPRTFQDTYNLWVRDTKTTEE